MTQNKKTARKYEEEKKTRNPKYRRRRNNSTEKDRDQKSHKFSDEKLDTSRSNNPSWYFLDDKLADQVSQLSFQNLAGEPILYDGKNLDVPNVVRIGFNPSPGVQLSANYNTGLSQKSGINMAAFRLYSKLSAFTGRVQSYAPQDVATMILAVGEVISITEFIRRAFGVAYTMNMRNRDYPATVLEDGMCIDADDLFRNFSDYRTKFNAILTLINQLPIPKSIAYFDKCASMYESIYLDSVSAMAQTLVPVPHTSWLLDEASYSGGTVLKTIPITADATWDLYQTPQPMSTYLNILEGMTTALLNSSSLHYIFMDIINLASKQGVEFWKMDFLFEEYTVLPKFDLNFLLQMHNATICYTPTKETTFVTGVDNVTPLNDVYPDPNKNALFYNPAFQTLGNTSNGSPRTGNVALIDMLNDQVSLTDRVEVTRYIAICKGKYYTPSGGGSNTCIIDTALPDHYCVGCYFSHQTNNLSVFGLSSTLRVITGNYYADAAAFLANIDWAPRIYEVDDNNSYQLTGRYTGDINFYTVVDANYIRKLHDFVSLALYDMR